MRSCAGGVAGVAYPSIVAGGANACVLHYIENRDPLRDGDLLLIDAGAEYDYYASDITRTFPVNGKFSRTQRALYDVVLEAQEAAIEQVTPGNHWNAPHEAAVEVLAEGLVALGLIKGRAGTVVKKGRYRKFYAHRTGHWLGMDVHDVGDYKIEGEWRVLEPGNGHDRRAGSLCRGGRQAGGPQVVEHRYPHRGRRARHERRHTRC